ncbi:MAG: translational GTPase TypA, partial [Rhizobium sp.]|nr:translational GTPase TypA [Rhizobium sp.]
ALKVGLRPIVAINKIDRPDGRHEEVINEVFDLFANLDATDEQLDFPILYGSGRDGWMNVSPEGPKDQGLAPLLDLVLQHVPEPSVGDEDGAFRMIGTILEANPFLGRIITGRIHSGSIKPNQAVKVIGQDGKLIENGRISKILAFRGIERTAIDEAHAGDIVAIAGLSKGTVADTFCDPSVTEPLTAQPIDPPTVTMSFLVNDSPLAGTEGDKVTSRVIRDRLFKEAEGNVALKIEEAEGKDSFFVSGRGELQLAVLIETMRREGFELAVGRPEVVIIENEAGEKQEPYENVTIDIEEQHQGPVMEQMGLRKGDLTNMIPDGKGRIRLEYTIPARGLIGFRNNFLTLTSGTGILTSTFSHYGPIKAGEVTNRQNGVLVSMATGTALTYSLETLQARGKLFLEPGQDIYEGQLCGINSRDNDLVINPTKGKKLDNMRASGKDEVIALVPPIKFTLEQALEFIADDELVEVTPKSIRLRKKMLNENDRKRYERSKV